MTNYLIRRLFQMIIVVFLSTMAIYLLLNIAPGGPLSGINLGADRRSRVSEAMKARLEAYLGLDKPLALRYFVWLLGDDWLGADWMYIGFGPYKQHKIGATGELMYKSNRDTGEQTPIYEVYRFWADPGIAMIEPAYQLWIWGEETGVKEKDNKEVRVFTADKIRVKPPKNERLPDDASIDAMVIGITGPEISVQNLNGEYFSITTTQDTEFDFPQGTARPRPEEGNWLNTSGIFGPFGLLSKYAGFHGTTRGLLRLDLGFSWKLSPGQPVIELIESRLGNTLTLMSTAAVISLIIAIPIGIYSAVNQYSRMDYIATTFSFFGSAMPVFWFGLMMILLFSMYFKEWGLPFLPSGGTTLVRAPQPDSLLAALGASPGSFVDRIVHIFMPAMVLSLLYMASWSRFMRTAMLEVLRMDYVRTARAKGLMERFVILKHAARNALIPLITIVVFQIPNIFGGAILTETIFRYPGMGRLYFNALNGDDWPIVMVILFISAVLVVIATLVRDILYTIVDPRIRFT